MKTVNIPMRRHPLICENQVFRTCSRVKPWTAAACRRFLFPSGSKLPRSKFSALGRSSAPQNFFGRMMAAVLALGLCLVANAAPPASLRATGIVEPFKKVTVGARANGFLESIVTDEGGIVKAGDVLAKMDDRTDQYEVEQREAQSRLWKLKAASAQKLKGIETSEKISETVAESQMAEALLKKAQKALEDKTIRAPIAGVVTHRYKAAGESVQEREQLFEVINVETVYFLAYFDAIEMRRAHEGQKAQMRLEMFGDETFEGTVSYVDPAVDAGSGQFRVRVLLPNPKGRIKAGLKGTITLLE